jgi:hypothetical protein
MGALTGRENYVPGLCRAAHYRWSVWCVGSLSLSVYGVCVITASANAYNYRSYAFMPCYLPLVWFVVLSLHSALSRSCLVFSRLRILSPCPRIRCSHVFISCHLALISYALALSYICHLALISYAHALSGQGVGYLGSLSLVTLQSISRSLVRV